MAFYTHLRSAVGVGTLMEESQFLTGRKSNFYFKNIQSQGVLIKTIIGKNVKMSVKSKTCT